MPSGSLKRSKNSSSKPVSTSIDGSFSSTCDEEVIKQILQGDKNKYTILVEKYQQMIFRTCMGFLHNKDDADDLTQEIFIQAYLSLANFKNKSAFSTWIYRIAVNASLNKIRKSIRNKILQRLDTLTGAGENYELSVPFTITDNPENLLISQEHTKMIMKVLNTLPENQHTAIVLSKYDDMSQKEISEIMNISESAVEALLHRAKKNLYNRLSGKRP